MDDTRDAEQRRIAEHIQWQKQGAWVVFWGVHTRRYWAFACWPVIPVQGVVISAVDPGDLYSGMREVEREHDYLGWRHRRRR
ncbi:hypothetical protein [Nocardiopsis sp. CC223A]|uniref:hypothetical protein n=1 Tax=Nocardiopsis sp. CC223A TaxID=3044051 RepID=UPI00278BE870|nr:hypothetical protein [Nocardiopsis sp. CC223A]